MCGFDGVEDVYGFEKGCLYLRKLLRIFRFIFFSVEIGIVSVFYRYRKVKFYRFIFCIFEKIKGRNCCCIFGIRYIIMCIIMLNRFNFIV